MRSENGRALMWPRVALGDIVKIHHGFGFRGEFFRDDAPGDILLTPGNFAVGGGFMWHKTKYYDGPVDDRFVLERGDLIITMTDLSKRTDTLGSPALVPSPPDGVRLLHNQRLGLVEITARDRVDLGFLYAALRSRAYRAQVVAAATGTTVKHTSPKRIERALIPLPPLADQRRIAAVVGALDDRIDSNRRLAGLLEETVAALFRARFVDFVGVDEFEEREIGLIPRGWWVGRLGDLVTQRIERCRPSETTSRLPYVPIDLIPARSFMLVEHRPGEDARSSLTAFEVGDILFGAMRPYFHKVAIAPFRGTTRTTVFVLRSARLPDWAYTALLLSQPTTIEFATRTSRGSTIPYAVWDGVLSEMPVVVPPPEERAAFDDIARPLLTQVQKAGFEQQALSQTRDLLLPKLISGQILVSDTTDPAATIGQAVDAAAAVS